MNAKDIIYRDELSKEKNKPKRGYSNSFESSEPLIKKDLGEKICTTCTAATNGERTSLDSSEEEKGVLRMKVLMTKQDAARLLSRCKGGGGVLEFKDVARELVQIPVNRVYVVVVGPLSTTCSGKVLHSIS
ncbi:hypothetical protein TorRG33x02_260640 [Trema orientale]|uniref:DUF7890 domain-containing protein n=1 Tax=Trema orientale TaxID=63057 RepID=A0A2P5D6T6_TREOI|nr:hypothetical protein TorRG33x02_260640 [Trema orientale]